MNIKKYIQNRKLEMVGESETLEKQQRILSAQLQQVNIKIAELGVELKVLGKIEFDFQPLKEK